MFHRGSRQLRAARSRSAGHQPLVSAHKPLQDLTLDVAAALLLACSVTMATDFSRRILAANPDELGIASIAVQAAFSVAATSTFTKAGWQWIDTLRSSLRIKALSKSRLRFSLALLLFIITCQMWIWAPDRLAVFYNNLGESLSTLDPPKALRYLQRSAALNPGLSAAHYNLGRLMEDSYQYDLAASQYQQAIAVNRQDLRSYNNLARLLLINGKAAIALSVLSDAPINGVQDTKALAAIYENRASADFDLGFSAQAIADAALSEKAYPNAAAYCLQGRIFAKTGQPTQAQVAWQSFKKMRSASDQFQNTATAECSLLAEAFHEVP
jgi:tetratricopeptide (TPR) repeat protein